MFDLEYFRSKSDQNIEIPILKTNDDLRSPEVKKEYQNFLNGLALQFISPEGYLIDKYKLKDKETILVANQFPYDLARGIKHKIFWINSNDLEYIKKALEIQKGVFSGLDHVFFQNEPQNQSVKRLTKFHFLYKI
jgi:hypothetical protein